MKLNLKNFTGTMELTYKIDIQDSESSITINKSIKTPTGKWIYYDSVVKLKNSDKSKNENLTSALQEAEYYFGIKLIKENSPILKTA